MNTALEPQTYIVRAAHDKSNPYYLGLRAVAQKRDLSWAARGMIAYFLSRQDDWKIQPKDLEQNCGRDKVYTILKELKEAGHLAQEPTRNDEAKYEDWHYVFYEMPQPLPEKPEVDKKPLPEKPYTAKPYTAKPDSTEYRVLENKEEDILSPRTADAVTGGEQSSLLQEDAMQEKPKTDQSASSAKSYTPAIQSLRFTLLNKVSGQSVDSLPPDTALIKLTAVVHAAKDGFANLKPEDEPSALLRQVAALNTSEITPVDARVWLQRVKDDTKDAIPGAGPAVAAPRPAPVTPSAITKVELESTTVDGYLNLCEFLQNRRVLHLAKPGEVKCLCGRAVSGLQPLLKAADDLTAAVTAIVPCTGCAMLEQKPKMAQAKIEPPPVEPKAEPAKTAAASAPVVEKLAKPKTPAAHVALIEAWMDTVGRQTIPADVTVKPFVRLGSNLLKGGVTPEDMICAGQLYKAWLSGLPGKIALTWDVGSVTNAVRQAQGMCKNGISAADVTKFVQDHYKEPFWQGKFMKFEYVALNIGAMKRDNVPVKISRGDPACKHCKGEGLVPNDAENRMEDCECVPGWRSKNA